MLNLHLLHRVSTRHTSTYTWCFRVCMYVEYVFHVGSCIMGLYVEHVSIC